MSHHYDQHDHEKLLRWRDDLTAAPIGPEGFPAMALFLVKPQATGSHEIFRRYRTEFEKRDASFAHLVVFGMHGVSATVRGLLDQADLSESDLPVMLLAPSTDPCAVTVVRLPSGESIEGADDPNGGGTCDYLAAWQDVLDRISITRPGRPLRLMGVQGQKLDGVDLSALAGAALEVAAAAPPSLTAD
ncbi:MAG: hypothetical protein OXF79_07020 [Chloroflexi bacterium]|nr:hypothetical protein [Chloroflexota bacterium]